MTGQRTITLLVFLVLIVGVILGACGTSTEYIKATAVKHGTSFSFEYPSTYTKLTPDAFEDIGDDYSVSLLYYEPGSTQAKADIQLYIIALTPIPGRSEASAWQEEQIKILEQYDDKFKLYENTLAQVSGLDGYKIVYFTTILGDYLHSHRVKCWDVYINYKEYTWKISVLAVEESSDQAERDFQHLIESFQFLD